MTENERAQVVACMSGSAPPPIATETFRGEDTFRDGSSYKGDTKKVSSKNNDISSIDPFGKGTDVTAAEGNAGGNASTDGSDDDAEAQKKPAKKKKDWDESSGSDDDDGDDDVDLNKRAAASVRGGINEIAAKRREREERERSVSRKNAQEKEKAEKKERRRRKTQKSAVVAAEAAAMMEQKLASMSSSRAALSVGSSKKPPSTRRPPEVTGFGQIPPGMGNVLPGPPPPFGTRLGGNEYHGFGNPNLTFNGNQTVTGASGASDWMANTQRTTESVLGQAKGWLSGALKGMADRLDGSGGGSNSTNQANAFGANRGPMADAEATRQRKSWEDAQRGLFLDETHVRGSKSKVGEKEAEGNFYSDGDDSSARKESSSSSDSDRAPQRSRARTNLVPQKPRSTVHKPEPKDRFAESFAASIKGLAHDFGGQANLSGFYSDGE